MNTCALMFSARRSEDKVFTSSFCLFFFVRSHAVYPAFLFSPFFFFFFSSPSLVISATLSAFSHENRETDPSLSFYLKMLANPQTLSKLSWLNEAEDRLIPPPPPSLEAPWCRRAENEGSPLAVCLDVEGKVNKHTIGDGAGN